MKRLTFLIASILMTTALQAKELTLADLFYYTESYPPYNYKEKGVAKGIAVDLLLEASAKIKHTVKNSDIKLVPWPRGYLSLTQDPNTVLFSTTRTQKREALFKWAGPIAPTSQVLMAKKIKKIKINDENDLKAYKIGAIRDDIGVELLTAKGLTAKNFSFASDGNAIAKRLARERIDLWVYDEGVARWFLSRNNFNSDDYEVVYELSLAYLYFAFSKDTPDELIEKLQLGIDEVKKKTGDNSRSLYDEIMDRYLKSTGQ